MRILRIVNEAAASSSPFAIARVVNEAAASSSPTEPRLRGEGKDENEVFIASAIARVVKEIKLLLYLSLSLGYVDKLFVAFGFNSYHSDYIFL